MRATVRQLVSASFCAVCPRPRKSSEGDALSVSNVTTRMERSTISL